MQIIILASFKRQLKPYIKKHKDLKEELIFSLDNFSKKNSISLGKGIYKIRFKIKNISRGKNKSFRVIVLLRELNKQLIPMVIFFKGDKESLSKKEINNSLETVLYELLMQDL